MQEHRLKGIGKRGLSRCRCTNFQVKKNNIESLGLLPRFSNMMTVDLDLKVLARIGVPLVIPLKKTLFCINSFRLMSK
jgi:hypothetical protein